MGWYLRRCWSKEFDVTSRLRASFFLAVVYREDGIFKDSDSVDLMDTEASDRQMQHGK